MLLEPRRGWEKFKKGELLLEFITESLPASQDLCLAISKNQDVQNDENKKTKDKSLSNKAVWEHYSFSENVCIWCSNELNATNQLQITFNSSNDRD